MGIFHADRRIAQHARFTTQSNIILAAQAGGRARSCYRSTRPCITPSYSTSQLEDAELVRLASPSQEGEGSRP
jgi:hypothetical protein